MTERDVLILGGKGQLGLMLQSIDWPQAVALHAPDRAAIDLEDEDAIGRLIAERNWALVINAAAYTAVDQAQEEVAQAWTLNAIAPALLAYHTGKADIPLIHVSTDYVFDGSKDAPYHEDDPVAPLGVYGASKEGGEQGVRTGNDAHVILRTAWVYGPHRANFVKTMLRLGQERDELNVVSDQTGNPTSTTDIAQAILAIATAIWDGKAHWGTYHVAGTGKATWYDFAVRIFELAAQHGSKVPTVHPIPASQYPTPATRPVNSQLDCSKLERDYGICTAPWPDALSETIKTLSTDDIQ